MITGPNARGIIKFSYADEVLRRDTGYHSCLWARICCGGPYPFPGPSALRRGCAQAGRGGEGQHMDLAP